MMAADNATFSIYDLLGKKSLQFTIREAVKFGENNEDSLTQSLVQLMIDCFGRIYEISQEELAQNVDKNLAIAIFESDESDDIGPGNFEKFDCFIKGFMKAIQHTDLIHNAWYVECIELLKFIVDSEEIPNDSLFKIQASVMCSSFLQPILGTKKHVNEKLDSFHRDSLLVHLNFCLSRIFALVQFSFRATNHSLLAAKNVHEAMHNYPEFVIQEKNFLSIYNVFFKFNEPKLNKLGLQSLEDLCDIQRIRSELLIFFFTPEARIVEFIKIAFSHKALELPTMRLFCKIQALDPNNRFLDLDTEDLVHNNLFSADKMLTLKAIEFIEIRGGNFWIIAVEHFCKYQKEASKLNRMVKVLFEVGKEIDFQNITSAIYGSFNDEHKIRAAIRLFTATIKADLKNCPQNFPDILPFLADIMQEGLDQSKPDVIGILMEFFVELNENMVKNSYLAGDLDSILDLLKLAFDMIDDYTILHNIVKFYQFLFEDLQVGDTQYIRDIFYELYLKIIEIADEFATTGRVRPFGSPVMKAALILEEKPFAPLVLERELIILNTICQKMMSTNFSDNPEDAPYFLRLQANVIKCFWLKFFRNERVAGDMRQLAVQIIRFNKNLFRMACNQEERCHLLMAMHISSSFMEISCLFQPNIRSISNNPVFEFTVYHLDKKDLKMFVKFLCYYLYEAKAETKLDEFCKQVILSDWILFNKNYLGMKSGTVSYRIIRMYRIKCQFQDLYEELMSMILSRSLMEFNETLALAMLSFEEIGNLDEFQKFTYSINHFLDTKLPLKQKQEAYLSTADKFLEMLCHLMEKESEASEGNRFDCLEFLEDFIKNIKSHKKRNLLRKIPKESALMTDEEKITLQVFKEKLQ